VDRPGKDFFSCSGLASEQNGPTASGDFPNDIADLSDLRIFAEQTTAGPCDGKHIRRDRFIFCPDITHSMELYTTKSGCHEGIPAAGIAVPDYAGLTERLVGAILSNPQFNFLQEVLWQG